MERAGPSTRSVPLVCLALLPTTGCRSLHRRVSRSFLEKKIRLCCCSAVAMPELDPEMMARLFWADQEGWARVEISTMSRALEVGRLVSLGSLHWFSVPCSGASLPGSAWGAYQVVDGIFYCQKTTWYLSSLSGDAHVACGKAASALRYGVTAGYSD